MKPNFIHPSFLARFLRVNAIVLYPFIFFAEKNPSSELINHELIHVDQIRRHGFMGFYFLYLKEYLSHRKNGQGHDEAYRNISFEKEAYAHQHDLNYLPKKTNIA